MNWNLGHVQSDEIKAKYQHIVESITESLTFMRTVGADTSSNALETVDLYTSHEGLLLNYEQSLTRYMPHPPQQPPPRPRPRRRRRLVQHLRALPLDRRPHAPTRRRTRRILPRPYQPHRDQSRPHPHPDRPTRPPRHPRPAPRAGQSNAHHALRRRAHRRPAPRAHRRRAPQRARRRLAVRPHARQHAHDACRG